MHDRLLPQLTIQQLDYLVAVDDHDTWAEAAASLGVTPSALSQGLAELERRLRVNLFERAGRRRMIAVDGEPVLQYARRVVALTGELVRWSEAVRSGAAGSIRVGMIDVAAIHHYSAAFRLFRDRSSDADIRLTVAPSRELLRAIARDEIDVAVTVRPLVMPAGLDWVELFEEPLAIYGPERVERQLGSVAPSGPWVLFPTSSHTRLLVERSLIAMYGSLEVVAESNQPDVLREMVRQGLGWTVLPEVQAGEGPGALHRVVPQPLVSRQLILVTRKGRISNALLSRFTGSIVEGELRPTARPVASDQ